MSAEMASASSLTIGQGSPPRIADRSVGISLSNALRPIILSYIGQNPSPFKTNGPGRRFAICVPLPMHLTDEAFAQFGILSYIEEPVLGNFVGNHFRDGAAVHAHTDKAPPGYLQVRCNLMLTMPTRGGLPIIDGTELGIEEGDMWICYASQEIHSSSPMFGGKRLVVSLGGLVAV